MNHTQFHVSCDDSQGLASLLSPVSSLVSKCRTHHAACRVCLKLDFCVCKRAVCSTSYQGIGRAHLCHMHATVTMHSLLLYTAGHMSLYLCFNFISLLIIWTFIMGIKSPVKMTSSYCPLYEYMYADFINQLMFVRPTFDRARD